MIDTRSLIIPSSSLAADLGVLMLRCWDAVKSSGSPPPPSRLPGSQAPQQLKGCASTRSAHHTSLWSD
eukprot:CAMPEP_0114139364 /NCGR_PEP_ID=MMETSP0043_2-20121206/16814_1 /TAXON_ID=464988 /ORGANISM="Hemiselmis andersenii, Strain CCMP644" /LENGTH=67 /DNA_ID=CAMNT_0001233391 /DNA_START=58 /DNA_END=261 /DNA_ORIENTATION=-